MCDCFGCEARKRERDNISDLILSGCLTSGSYVDLQKTDGDCIGSMVSGECHCSGVGCEWDIEVQICAEYPNACYDTLSGNFSNGTSTTHVFVSAPTSGSGEFCLTYSGTWLGECDNVWEINAIEIFGCMSGQMIDSVYEADLKCKDCKPDLLPGV